MSLELPFDVAVIGAGASGALLAAQFSRLAPAGARLALIGVGERPARGVAYEAPYRANLLNVPAGNMSAFPDDREHFLSWLAERMPAADDTTFAQRRLYGDYLASVLGHALRSEAIVPVKGNAIQLTQQAGLWRVLLDNGLAIETHAVVLATGNLLMPGDPLDVSRIAHFYRRNPWAAGVLDGLDADAPVLLIGTGLTMVDVVLSLRESGHRGPIHAVSRHGRLYQRHQTHPARPMAQVPHDFRSPLGALRWLRSEIERDLQNGGDWRTVIDSLRPHTAAIWQGWSMAQRASFLRHTRNLWDIHRHRMAPEIAAQLDELMVLGVLRIHAGRIVQASSDGTAATIRLRTAHTQVTFTLQVARVINCSGPGRDYAKAELPLVAQMRQQGWLTPDPLRLGVETGPDGQLVDASGCPVAGLFTLGPLRIPGLWESIAIPEIRSQALDLAKLLVREFVETPALSDGN
ncbi:MAG: FAD/NAD(P)-binding protein [Chloroflexi bacterium]|nr:FAD/NAD(P)-binding protein [Chloroflexota bacterium]